MFSYGNRLGSLADQDVIETRVTYSTNEKKDRFKDYYNAVYKKYYDEVYKAYEAAGYGQAYTTQLPGMNIITNMIPVFGGLIGGLFGSKRVLKVPVKEVKKLAKKYATEAANKAVEDEDKLLAQQLKDDVDAQRMNFMQKSRGDTAFITQPTGISVNKRGALVTAVKGETVMTPSK